MEHLTIRRQRGWWVGETQELMARAKTLSELRSAAWEQSQLLNAMRGMGEADPHHLLLECGRSPLASTQDTSVVAVVPGGPHQELVVTRGVLRGQVVLHAVRTSAWSRLVVDALPLSLEQLVLLVPGLADATRQQWFSEGMTLFGRDITSSQFADLFVEWPPASWRSSPGLTP